MFPYKHKRKEQDDSENENNDDSKCDESLQKSDTVFKSKKDTHNKPKEKHLVPTPMTYSQLLQLAAKKQNERTLTDETLLKKGPERLMTEKQKLEFEREQEIRLNKGKRPQTNNTKPNSSDSSLKEETRKNNSKQASRSVSGEIIKKKKLENITEKSEYSSRKWEKSGQKIRSEKSDSFNNNSEKASNLPMIEKNTSSTVLVATNKATNAVDSKEVVDRSIKNDSNTKSSAVRVESDMKNKNNSTSSSTSSNSIKVIAKKPSIDSTSHKVEACCENEGRVSELALSDKKLAAKKQYERTHTDETLLKKGPERLMTEKQKLEFKHEQEIRLNKGKRPQTNNTKPNSSDSSLKEETQKNNYKRASSSVSGEIIKKKKLENITEKSELSSRKWEKSGQKIRSEKSDSFNNNSEKASNLPMIEKKTSSTVLVATNKATNAVDSKEVVDRSIKNDSNTKSSAVRVESDMKNKNNSTSSSTSSNSIKVILKKPSIDSISQKVEACCEYEGRVSELALSVNQLNIKFKFLFEKMKICFIQMEKLDLLSFTPEISTKEPKSERMNVSKGPNSSVERKMTKMENTRTEKSECPSKKWEKSGQTIRSEKSDRLNINSEKASNMLMADKNTSGTVLVATNKATIAVDSKDVVDLSIKNDSNTKSSSVGVESDMKNKNNSTPLDTSSNSIKMIAKKPSIDSTSQKVKVFCECKRRIPELELSIKQLKKKIGFLEKQLELIVIKLKQLSLQCCVPMTFLKETRTKRKKQPSTSKSLDENKEERRSSSTNVGLSGTVTRKPVVTVEASLSPAVHSHSTVPTDVRKIAQKSDISGETQKEAVADTKRDEEDQDKKRGNPITEASGSRDHQDFYEPENSLEPSK